MSTFPVSKDHAKDAIGQMIKEVGLDAVTSAKIREYLKGKFHQDFLPWKKEVDELTREKIEEAMASPKREKKEESEDEGVKEQSDAGSSSAASSDEDEKKPVKEEKPAKSRARKAPSPVEDDSDDDLISKVKRRRGSAPVRKAPSATRKKQPKGTGRFSKVCYISEDLQLITNQAYMRRCDVVKYMWQYIREHNLKSPKDGRVVLCDENLKRIFKKERFQAFGMMSVLKDHIFNPDDLGEEYVDAARDAQAKLIEELNKNVIKDDADADVVNDNDEDADDE